MTSKWPIYRTKRSRILWSALFCTIDGSITVNIFLAFTILLKAARAPWVRLVGISLARLKLSMEKTLKIVSQSSRANSSKAADYSIYTLVELFKERYWVDANSDPNRSRSLEEEIQKRCAHIRERANPTASSATSSKRFRPYGFMYGIVFLFFCVGPFVTVSFLKLINVITDVDRDVIGLSGVWALITVPLLIVVFLLGAMRDAERVVQWFNLAGR